MKAYKNWDAEDLLTLDREDICMMDDDELNDLLELANEMLDNGEVDEDIEDEFEDFIDTIEDRLYNAW